MECKNCGNELTGRQKTFCSDKCRKRAVRAAVKTDKGTITRTNHQTRTDYPAYNSEQLLKDWREGKGTEWQCKIGTLAKQYEVINSMPTRWVNSPEHKALMAKLKSTPIEQLEAEGYYIPCWKHQEAAA